MLLFGMISIGNIGVNVSYVYILLILLSSIIVYCVIRKIYKWAIQKQLLRFLSYVGTSTFVICLTAVLAIGQERDVWHFLKAAMQSLAFLGFSLALFPLLHQFILKRK
ncbi:hypothetical protein [Oceanobacillus sp. J11TS1]|uniref:hypothetical protein n=1 Tax=Oceanobacillus sp. J11TS1 TaxID=2807191 RepID=UPI001B084EE9|nr:hypothetical protein [Oceanobacillus sp. J11TS1]GIO22370.1 hypothetical protein J11TS1_09510 [Oceanobacillus sp. J11TS1]